MSSRRQRVAVGAGAATVVIALVIVALVNGGGSSAPPRAAASTPSVSSTTSPPVSTAPATTVTAPPPPLTPGPPAQPAPSAVSYGVNVNRLFNDGTYSQGQIDSQLAAVHATGATVARSDAFWESAEPAPPVKDVHVYKWQSDDQIAGSLAAHQLRWMPIIDYAALWSESATGQDHSAPASPADYATYAAAFAARYGPHGSFWSTHPTLTPEPVQTYEIWNEPDNGQFWAPAPSAATYAALYEQARTAIESADPSARVIIGGLTNPTSFLPAILAARPQLRGHVDGVGIHPYGTPLVVLSKVRAARATMSSLGLGTVPLYVTEIGWTTMPTGTVDYAAESLRPGYLQATIPALGHTNCAVAAVLLYTWVTPERNPTDGQDWYGIASPNGGSTADVTAFTMALHKAATEQASIPLCSRR